MMVAIKNFVSGGVAALLFLPAPAQAGFLMAPGVKWGSFSARPEGTEATPNYQGVGGELTVGYSFDQVFDLAFFGSYIPGRRKAPKFGVDDVSLISAGASVGFRFASSVYLGFKGGHSVYAVQHAQDENEINSRHDGLGYGLSIGAIGELSKENFLQTTFDLTHHVLTSSDDTPGVIAKRRFDGVSITVAYVFNGRSNSSVKNGIFKSFLDSITFF